MFKSIKLTYVYSYYENLQMLKEQIRHWTNYSGSVLDRLEIIITDDCSTVNPIEKAFPLPEEIRFRIFRIKTKVPWNWLACRNIGAKNAVVGSWILMTDMDHVLQARHADRLIKLVHHQRLCSDNIYLFNRIDAPNDEPYKPHNDSFLLTREMFWKIGGYDEELSGHYGTSGNYRRRAFRFARDVRLSIPLTRYDRNLISDASTTQFTRKEPEGAHKRAFHKILNRKEEEGRLKEVRTLSFPYEELQCR